MKKWNCWNTCYCSAVPTIVTHHGAVIPGIYEVPITIEDVVNIRNLLCRNTESQIHSQQNDLRSTTQQIPNIFSTLFRKFRNDAKEGFMIEQVLKSISSYPEFYPASRKQKGLRKCVFSKQTSIYYRINNDYIEIVSFSPNRKDPNNNFTT